MCEYWVVAWLPQRLKSMIVEIFSSLSQTPLGLPAYERISKIIYFCSWGKQCDFPKMHFFSDFSLLFLYSLHQNYLQVIFSFFLRSMDFFFWWGIIRSFCWKGTGWVVTYCWEVATFTLFSTFLLEKCSPQLCQSRNLFLSKTKIKSYIYRLILILNYRMKLS